MWARRSRPRWRASRRRDGFRAGLASGGRGYGPEERVGFIVGRINQLHLQLVQRHVPGAAERGDHGDRPNQLLTDAEVRAQHTRAVCAGLLRDSEARR